MSAMEFIPHLRPAR